jgi:hypothetical protein
MCELYPCINITLLPQEVLIGLTPPYEEQLTRLEGRSFTSLMRKT